jgi:hypothetical protein
MNIVRFPPRDFDAELDQHDASFEAEEGELVAGLAHLNSLAVPGGEPLRPVETESFTRLIRALVCGVIAVGSLAVLADFLTR